MGSSPLAPMTWGVASGHSAASLTYAVVRVMPSGRMTSRSTTRCQGSPVVASSAQPVRT